jgi:hypothetical protein
MQKYSMPCPARTAVNQTRVPLHGHQNTSLEMGPEHLFCFGVELEVKGNIRFHQMLEPQAGTLFYALI